MGGGDGGPGSGSSGGSGGDAGAGWGGWCRGTGARARGTPAGPDGDRNGRPAVPCAPGRSSVASYSPRPHAFASCVPPFRCPAPPTCAARRWPRCPAAVHTRRGAPCRPQCGPHPAGCWGPPWPTIPLPEVTASKAQLHGARRCARNAKGAGGGAPGAGGLVKAHARPRAGGQRPRRAAGGQGGAGKHWGMLCCWGCCCWGRSPRGGGGVAGAGPGLFQGGAAACGPRARPQGRCARVDRGGGGFGGGGGARLPRALLPAPCPPRCCGRRAAAGPRRVWRDGARGARAAKGDGPRARRRRRGLRSPAAGARHQRGRARARCGRAGTSASRGRPRCRRGREFTLQGKGKGRARRAGQQTLRAGGKSLQAPLCRRHCCRCARPLPRRKPASASVLPAAPPASPPRPHRGEMVMFSAFSVRVPARSSFTTRSGQPKPSADIFSAAGTSMMISFSVGLASPFTLLRYWRPT
jgi:hypothetical protein